MATPTGFNNNKMARFSSLSRPFQSEFGSEVRVVVRVRPFLASEIAISTKGENPFPCISVLDSDCGSGEEATVHIQDQETSQNECYRLDSFYGQQDEVVQIFNREVTPVLPGIFHGRNATVFAYGATGSGKTYTMQGTDEKPGLMPLTMSTILSMCNHTAIRAEISFFEIYLDRCYDLLEPKPKEISVLEDKDGQIQLKGLSRIPIRSMVDFNEIFSIGMERRRVGHNGLNDISSRSHGVLSIVVSDTDESSRNCSSGKLNLIDLAGNEDNRRTQNRGISLQESAKINQSLFTLSNVIYALNNNEARVPYRESKLTRILQDSLGGNSRALMIACLNPTSYRESVHTVSLAARSRQIKNFVSPAQKKATPREKIDMEVKLRAWLESKGKTKSLQRAGAPCSPFFGRTPTPASSVKKPNTIRSSANAKITEKAGSIVRGRKMLDFGTSIAAAMEESYSMNVAITKKPCSLDKDSYPEDEDSKDNLDTMNADDCREDMDTNPDTMHDNDQECFPKDEDSKDNLDTMYVDDCREDRDTNPDTMHDNDQVMCIQRIDDIKEDMDPNHNNDNDQLNPSEGMFLQRTNDNREDMNANHDTMPDNDQLNPSEAICLNKANDFKEDPNSVHNIDLIIKPWTCLTDRCSDKENMMSPSLDLVRSPNLARSSTTLSSRTKDLQDSSRNALSPIEFKTDMTPYKEFPSKDQARSARLEPRTPKTPYVLIGEDEESQTAGTPLDKFNARGSSLKSIFVEEYLAFLNTASKEELLGLKGIGQKRADYILQLRETTPHPLKTLRDLEKIGLSSKQVHHLFKRAATGIFS